MRNSFKSPQLTLVGIFVAALQFACLQDPNVTPTVTPTPTVSPTVSPTATPSSYTITSPRRFVYGTAHTRQHVDFYSAVGDNTPRPLILYIHGGAWVLAGDPNTYESLMKTGAEAPMKNLTQHFINNGFAVGIMKYRHPKYIKKSNAASNVPMEQSALYNVMQDINSAFDILVNNANTLKIDTSRLGLIGDSAGAHMAAMYAYGYGGLSYQSQLKTVVPLYGPFDLSQPDTAPSFYSYPYNGKNPALFVTSVLAGTFGNTQSQDEDNSPLSISIYLMRAFDCLTGEFYSEQASSARRKFSPVHLAEQKGPSNLPMTFVVSAANDALINPNQLTFIKNSLSAQQYSDSLVNQPTIARHLTVNVPGFNHGFVPINSSLKASTEFERAIEPMILKWFNARLK